ncbi:unnamed protein product [Ilex paraguariensis]|uniref:Clp R domain-containing protein n=1 Tax=Ilex paraguariensis TaxID=185542 RepID=A0ABC8R698_9AQUA
MRAGLGTIQQTLTPEAASVLNHSIAEAGRRNHGQTTPLHVAATLLASPTGFLRQACIRSHPNSSHPLQCRALELCFSVALERLPTAQNISPAMEPPVSNALMAALKRAQAHQRRGCPEQQQQPLLAVKVELEQLIISILDDPSVSRVMREASFSSPAVKAIIEQSLNSSLGNVNQATLGIGFRPNPTPMPIPNRNLYLNPRLQQANPAGQPGNQRNEEVKRVIDILLRTKKRNPVLVGEAEPEAVVKELLRRVEKGELNEGPLKNAQVISIEKELVLDKTRILSKIKELEGLIETKIGNSNGGGIIIDLGDLKWLVEQPVTFGVPPSGGVQQQVVSEAGRVAVAEMGKILGRFGEGSNDRIWLIGTATCETFWRCQVYHQTIESDWDLQEVPIPSRSPVQGMFPRLGTNGTMSPSVQSLHPLKSFTTATPAFPRRVSDNVDHVRRVNCCLQCSETYEQELAELVAEFEKSSSEVKSEAAKIPLPQWLQNAKLNSTAVKTSDQTKCKEQELLFKQKSQDLQKKWNEKCPTLHPNFHHNLSSERISSRTLSMPGLYNPNLLMHRSLQPKLQPPRHLGETLQLNSSQTSSQPSEHVGSLPGSPVRTDLVLGQTKVAEAIPEKTPKEHVKDFLGCMSSEPQTKSLMESLKFAKALDADSFKKLLKGLMEKAWWQSEAASNVATTVTQCKLGNGKRRTTGSKGDTWLLFTGPDRMGMKKMASVLSEHVCGASPIIIYIGSRRGHGESDVSIRGKTALDRIVEAIRRNPFSVIMLEDIDEADMLVRGSIKRAMERGRITDSHGREISLGNIIFILAGNWSPVESKNLGNQHFLNEKNLATSASGSWQLRLTMGNKSTKRRANWLHDEEDRSTRPRREMGTSLSFDLNEAADTEDYRTDGSLNSSGLTMDHEDELGLENSRFAIASVPRELANSVDGTVVFSPVDFGSISCEIKKTITKSFLAVINDKLSIEVEDNSVEKILGGVWHGQTSLTKWAEKVLVPSFHQLKALLPGSVLASSDESMVIRLEVDADADADADWDSRSNGDWLPSKIRVVVDGV